MAYDSSNPNTDPRLSDDRVVVNEPADRTSADGTTADRPVVDRPTVYEERTKPARTSIAAAFALGVAVTALVCALVVILGPLGLILGIVGIVLSIFGIRNGGKLGITGRGMSIVALIISIVAAVLGGAIVAGVSTFLTNQQAVDRFENQLDQWRDRLPDVDVPEGQS